MFHCSGCAGAPPPLEMAQEAEEECEDMDAAMAMDEEEKEQVLERTLHRPASGDELRHHASCLLEDDLGTAPRDFTEMILGTTPRER